MLRDGNLDDEKIEDMLKLNPIKRNAQLVTFIKLLNSIDKNTFLTIDGDWGSGKTVFIKQLDYLNRNQIEEITTINKEAIAEFKNNYTVYTYNAWQHDYHEDPLESLLFALINDVWTDRERFTDKFLKFSEGLKQSIIKVSSAGLYDADEIRKASSIADLAASVTTASERRDAVQDILDNHIDLNGKKLLFIIDELDRCRPSFAVKLLEVIKHYYANDNVVFLLSTNNRQLAHTIKKVYGESFDGMGYLNKFYDLIFDLPEVEVKDYANFIGKDSGRGTWKDEAPIEVAKHLNMSMRQINRFYSSLSLIDNFLGSETDVFDNNLMAYLVKYTFVPLAYGLRVIDLNRYDQFVRGDGIKDLIDYLHQSETLLSVLEHEIKNGDLDREKLLAESYGKLFADDSYNRESYRETKAAQVFKRVVVLMNSSGTIDRTEIIA